MDKFSATTGDKVLTLAWEKAATRETPVFHPWRYFKAEGETLKQIETAISDFSNVAQAYEDLAKKVGAKSYNGSYFNFDFDHKELQELTGNERTDNNYTGGPGSEPFQCARIARFPGWVVTNSRAYGQFIPDVATPEGAALRDECKALKDIAQPMVRFARWLGCAGVSVPTDPAYPYGNKTNVSATATKIGGEWIVAVPVVITGNDYSNPTAYKQEWTVPPDSKPLTVSEYFGLLEKNSLIPNQPKAPGV